jgi:asparagine synthetase B (glutamine-hydrolysing)
LLLQPPIKPSYSGYRKMCGICGIVRFDGLMADTRQLVKKMSAKLIHRGPDHYGYH